MVKTREAYDVLAAKAEEASRAADDADTHIAAIEAHRLAAIIAEQLGLDSSAHHLMAHNHLSARRSLRRLPEGI